MENKYYTPDIEEFHVGFEYEEFYKETWRSVLYSGMGTTLYNFYSGNESIRVKYLDQEDIESLGFEAKDRNGYGSAEDHFLLEEKEYGVGIKKGILSIHLKDHMGGNYGKGSEYILINPIPESNYQLYSMQYFGDSSFKISTLFKGTIKNKSELKRVLKTIGYDK